MQNSTKSLTICNALRQDILNGKFDATHKLPSEHQLMRRFSVARETVRCALKALGEKNLIERRPGRGTFLIERAKLRSAQKFGIIVPDAYYPFYARICRGIDNAAKAIGWSTLSADLGSGDMRGRATKALDFAEICVREKVGGVFFQPLQFLNNGQTVNQTILKVLSAARIPVVLLDSDYLPLPQRSEYDLVGVDNVQLGYALAKHVIARGAKRIWYFSNPLPAPTSVNRGNGVGLAVVEAGLKWTRESIYFADPADTRAARRLFAGRNRPDAIIAVNDYVASILLRTLKTIGKRVPQDVLLAGVNGDPVAEEMDPPLTTVVQPCAEIGRAAVELMQRRLGDECEPARTVMLSTEMVMRKSTQRAFNKE